MPRDTIAQTVKRPGHRPLDRWQYRLSAHPHHNSQPIGTLHLSTGPGLPVTRVIAAGCDVAVILGFPIDLTAKRLLGSRWHVPPGGHFQDEGGIHKILRALGGRYALIHYATPSPRLYPDAVTGVSCVWDADRAQAGATAAAILTDADYQNRFNRQLFADLQICGQGWFPAGLTAHRGIERLLPNHYLDLSQWTAHRFAAVPASQPTPQAVVDGITRAVQDQCAALIAGPKRLAVALTAGRDSRAIVACLRTRVSDIDFVTVTGPDRHQTDTTIARQISSAHGLHHITLPRQTADKTAQEKFMYRGGHCYGDSNTRYHPSVAPLRESHVFAGGLGGEVARAFYWNETDDPCMTVTPTLLMDRFGLGRTKMVEAALQRWLSHLPEEANARKILDLAYVENRLGPWAMAQFCTDPYLVRHAPMVTYDTMRLMLDLPDDWKAQDRLNEAIVAHNWPELNDHPYNTLGPLRDAWGKVLRIKDNPRRILRRVFHRFT